MKVQLRFHPQIAASIKERTWHASQQFKDRSDGSVVMTLEVSDDYALRSWILGFGRFVRVLAPAHLVDWIQEELDQARAAVRIRRPRARGGQRRAARPAVPVQSARERVRRPTR